MAETRSYHNKAFSDDSGTRSHISPPLSRTRSVAGPRPLPNKSTGRLSQQAPDSVIHNAPEQPFPPIVSPKPQKLLPAVQNEITNVMKTQYQSVSDYENYQVSGTQSWYVGDDEKLQDPSNPDNALYDQLPSPKSPGGNDYIPESNRDAPIETIQSYHQYLGSPPHIQNDPQLQQHSIHYEPNDHLSDNPSYESQEQGYPIQELTDGMQEITIQQRDLPQHTNRSVLPAVPITDDQTQYHHQQFDQNRPNSWSSGQLMSDDNGQQYTRVPEYLDQGSSEIHQHNISSSHYRHLSIGPDGEPIPPSLSGGDRGIGYFTGENRTPTPDRDSKMPALKLLIDEKIARRRTATSKTLALNENFALEKYRDAAEKTNDPAIQMDYAKFLMQMVESYNSSDNANVPNNGPETANKLNEEAVYWINKLAKNNYAEALYIKGTWHECGTHGKEKSEEKAFKLYVSSSKQGFSKARRKVAEYHEKSKDYKRALQFYKKAASLGDIVAMNRLALIYMHGELRQDVDFKQALIYLKQAASKANDECPDGAYVYGMILARDYNQMDIPDDLVVPDDYEAKELILKAANLGHAGALFKMGFCYEYAALGCQFDPVLSIQYYKRAAEKGHTEADMSLCKWYLCGCEGYFEQNEEMAYEYAERAAMSGLPAAEFAMGYFHEVGIHVPANLAVANTWYTKASEHGNKDAKERLSKGGTFTRMDYEQNKLIKLNEKEEKGKDCVIQ